MLVFYTAAAILGNGALAKSSEVAGNLNPVSYTGSLIRGD
jgi:hypothetical protein